MALVSTKKPCAECPFRRTSTQGYLGPWDSPESLIQAAHSDFGGGFACHLTVKQNGSWEGAQVCAGSLLSANKSFKLYSDPELSALQTDIDTAPIDEVMDAQEFMEYHNSGPFK